MENKEKNTESEVVIRVTCKNDKEAERINKEIFRLVRKIRDIKNEKVNHQIVLENLDTGKIHTSINKREPREVSL